MSLSYPGLGLQRASLLAFIGAIKGDVEKRKWDTLRENLRLLLRTLNSLQLEDGWDPLLVIRGMVEHPDAERRLLHQRIQTAIQQTEKMIERLERGEPSLEECEELLQALEAIRPPAN
ncbi:MAG: hypothetical protein J7J32_06030, partial [Candidatus Atribacteria bacterium]|nr:hypothetical protein [Candidatus Atribacteria bacterium]MCD6349956.1 hypothetical protein [Candidatus Atribacteria bacterium]